MLHPRTTIPVMRYNIPVTIRNIFKLSEPGTRISQSPMKSDGHQVPLKTDSVVKGFATIDNVVLINVEGYISHF